MACDRSIPAATLGSLTPHSVGTPRPSEGLDYRGWLELCSIQVGSTEVAVRNARPAKGRGVPTDSGPCIANSGFKAPQL